MFASRYSYIEVGDIASEGRVRINLAKIQRELGRLNEARLEIRRAFQCKQGLGHAGLVWNAWIVLAEIETYAGNPGAAAEARAKAVAPYLAYRRDGGENHNSDGRIALAVTEPLLAGDTAGAAAILQQLAAAPDLPAWLRPFLQAPAGHRRGPPRPRPRRRPGAGVHVSR